MKRTVISKSARKFNRPKGSAYYIRTEQVVYKQQIGKKKNGKPAYSSITRHEVTH